MRRNGERRQHQGQRVTRTSLENVSHAVSCKGRMINEVQRRGGVPGRVEGREGGRGLG